MKKFVFLFFVVFLSYSAFSNAMSQKPDNDVNAENYDQTDEMPKPQLDDDMLKFNQNKEFSEDLLDDWIEERIKEIQKTNPDYKPPPKAATITLEEGVVCYYVDDFKLEPCCSEKNTISEKKIRRLHDFLNPSSQINILVLEHDFNNDGKNDLLSLIKDDEFCNITCPKCKPLDLCPLHLFIHKDENDYTKYEGPYVRGEFVNMSEGQTNGIQDILVCETPMWTFCVWKPTEGNKNLFCPRMNFIQDIRISNEESKK